MDYGMHVIVAGDPLTGFTIYGPFKTRDQACEWAAMNPKTDFTDEAWWAMPLESPEDDDTLSTQKN